MTHIFIMRNRQAGTTMIEVLVTVVIIAIGLLGLAGLQSRLQVSEIESYQRSQALMLLNDMSSRLSTNRRNAASYATGTTALGTGMTCPTTTVSSTLAQVDLSEWCNALQGAAEKKSGASVGVMVGGRGCVESLGSNRYMISVVWQGLAPVSAPPASVTCGAGQYTGGECTGELCRRAVTTLVQISPLM